MANVTEQARTLASAVVTTALELSSMDADGALHMALLETPCVQAALPDAVVSDQAAQVELICRLAVHLAREVLDVWRADHPDQQGPVEAVEAAEAWATCPCAPHAEAAATAAVRANQQAQMAWQQPSKSAAWAGRTAAWAADAPKYGWQAVSTIVGACRAKSFDRIVAVTAEFLAHDSSD